MSRIAAVYDSKAKSPSTPLERMLEVFTSGVPVRLHRKIASGAAAIGIAGVPPAVGSSIQTDMESGMFVDGFVFHRDVENVRRFESTKELRRALETEGGDFFNSVEGEFAFVGLIDEPSGGLIVARDPLGIKPLYYATADESVFFASEVKALIPLTESIHIFPPGHYWTPRSGFARYWTPPAAISEDSDLRGSQERLEVAAASVQELLVEAIARRIPRTDQVGILLSGGIDSSVIAAGLSSVLKSTGKELVSFSVGVPGANDLTKARTVAEYVGCEHHQLECELDQILEALPTVIYELESFDLPLVRSAAINHFACELAREHDVEWIFVGEGGDELFAGYSYLKDLKDPDFLRRELLRLTLNGHRGGFQRVDRMNEAHGLEPLVPFADIDLFAYSMQLPVEYKIREEDGLEKWVLREAFSDALPPEVVWREKEKFFEGSGVADGISRLIERLPEKGRITPSLARELAEVGVRSPEEAYYYEIFREYFPANVVPLIGRTKHV